MEVKTFTVKEVSKILNVGESTVRELINQGKLKKLNINKPIRIAQSAINELLGVEVQKPLTNNSMDIILKKKDILDLISTITNVQNMTNELLILLQNKLK
jgi:excisionase family DNA binding protein